MSTKKKKPYKCCLSQEFVASQTDTKLLAVFHARSLCHRSNSPDYQQSPVILLNPVFSYPPFKNRIKYILPFPGYTEKV